MPSQKPCPDFSQTIVLGDSLSDCGNAGRFCDGPVWVELLARHLGHTMLPSSRGGTNFAVGGAHIMGGRHDLHDQCRELLTRTEGELDPGALYIVYAGGNDLLAGTVSLRLRGAAERATAALDDVISRLVQAGACRLLVPNLPNLARIPVVPSLARSATERLTRSFNARLERRLRRWSSSGQAQIWHIDVFAEVERMVATDDGVRLLFCDAMHPSATVHRHIAAIAAAAVRGGARAAGARAISPPGNQVVTPTLEVARA